MVEVEGTTGVAHVFDSTASQADHQIIPSGHPLTQPLARPNFCCSIPPKSRKPLGGGLGTSPKSCVDEARRPFPSAYCPGTSR